MDTSRLSLAAKLRAASGLAACLAALCVVPFGCHGRQSCQGPGECASGERCLQGSCFALGEGGAGGLGDVCTAATDCAAGQECRASSAEFPGGACVASCAVGPAGDTTCGAGGRCITSGAGGACVPTCTGPASCRSGYECVTLPGVAGSVCRVHNAPLACPVPRFLAGGLQGPPAAPTSCQKPVVASALPPPGQILLAGPNPRTVGDSVQFTVPPGTGGLSILSQARSAVDSVDVRFSGDPSSHTLGNTVVPTALKDPSGRLIYDDEANPPDDLTQATAVYDVSSPVTGAFSIPNATPLLSEVRRNSGLPAGTWSFTVNDFALECSKHPVNGDAGFCFDGGSTSGTYDITVLAKKGVAAAGTINLAIYLVRASSVTSSAAPTDPRLRRMVLAIAAVYAKASICLGDVTFYDVPAWAKTKYGTSLNVNDTGPCGDLHQMFTLSAAGNTLNLFLVDAIVSSDNNGTTTVVGIDGTIPGPSSLGGTVHSGAAVSGSNLGSGACSSTTLDFAGCGPDKIGYIAAHEGGHWLGLYHPTESEGTFFDPLADTPTCACKTCVAPSKQAMCGTGATPTQVFAADCNKQGPTCGGIDNLMFWLFDPAAAVGTLTDEQGQVARSNPLVQ